MLLTFDISLGPFPAAEVAREDGSSQSSSVILLGVQSFPRFHPRTSDQLDTISTIASMTDFQINDGDLANFKGKVAIITGTVYIAMQG